MLDWPGEGRGGGGAPYPPLAESVSLVNAVHRLDVPVPCLPCGIELKCESDFSKHLMDVHNSNVVCELCGKSFVSKVEQEFPCGFPAMAWIR